MRLPESLDAAAIAAALLGVLLWWLWQLGPVMPPDAGSFIAAADALLRADSAAELRAGALAWSFYRAPLYPGLILLARALLGGAWPWGLVALQLAMATLATLTFHAALRALTGSRWLAAFGALAQATSFAMVLHPAILSDSLYASLLCLVLSLLLQGGLRGGISPARAFTAGVLLGLATLLREVGAYLNLLWLPLLLAAGGGRLPRRLGTAALALLPMLAAPAGLLAWNLARAGQPFLTTVGQVVYLQALLPLAARGFPVFAADPLLAEAARAIMPPFTNVEVIAVNQALFHDHAMQAPLLARLASTTWQRAWATYPLPMALAAALRIKAHHLFTLFIPIENFAQVPLWAEGAPRLLARFDRFLRAAFTGFAPELLLGVLALVACRLLALGTMLGFLAAPLVAWHRRNRAAWLALASWPILPCTVLAHALVHLEIRYVVPAMPAAIAASMWLLAECLSRRRPPATAIPSAGNRSAAAPR